MRVLDNIKKLEENGTEKPHVNKFCSLGKNLLTELSVSLFAHLTKKTGSYNVSSSREKERYNSRLR